MVPVVIGQRGSSSYNLLYGGWFSCCEGRIALKPTRGLDEADPYHTRTTPGVQPEETR